MLTKAHSNLSKDPILQDIQCFLSSTEHSQLTALITLQNWALDFRCQLSYEQESQHKKKCNSTILSQFLVSCSQIRWAETVIESTASVLIRTLMYSAKYKERVFLLSLMLQSRECLSVTAGVFIPLLDIMDRLNTQISYHKVVSPFDFRKKINLRSFKQFYIYFNAIPILKNESMESGGEGRMYK